MGSFSCRPWVAQRATPSMTLLQLNTRFPMSEPACRCRRILWHPRRTPPPINRRQLLDGLKASWAGGWFSQPLSHLLNFPVQTDCRAGWILFNLHWYTTSSTSGSSSGGPAPPARPGWKFSIVYLDVVLSSPCRLCRTCLMRTSQFW